MMLDDWSTNEWPCEYCIFGMCDDPKCKKGQQCQAWLCWPTNGMKKTMYSSTTLKGPSESGCWKQLDYAEQNADSLFKLMYRSDLGVAAHAVMQYCVDRNTETEDQVRKTGEEVGNLLIRDGYTYRGHKQPPMPANDVWQGVDVAVNYLLAKGLPTHPTAYMAAAEVDYKHPDLPYAALIDLRQQYDDGDEESAYSVDEAADYKSSWQDDESALDTLQRWGQTVIAWRTTGEDTQVIRQRVINLRTWKDYTRDLWLDNPDDVAELEKWEGRIKELCETARGTVNPGTGERQANPGIGCLSCPYRHICEDVWKLPRGTTDADLALAYAETVAQLDLFAKALKGHWTENNIAIPGGYVGYKAQPRRVIQSGAEKAILDDWLATFGDDLPQEFLPILQSLIKAFKLGKGNLDAFAKALYSERKKGIGEVRDEYVANITDEIQYGQFGVWKNDSLG